MTNEREAIRRIMISINKIDELYERVQRKAGVKELESDGYVRMETISGQRREMHIYLTEAGKNARQVFDSFYQAKEEAYGQIENAKILFGKLENFCQKLDADFDRADLIFLLLHFLPH